MSSSDIAPEATQPERDIYGISRWGSGLVRILENGNIGLVPPARPDATPADLVKIIDDLNQRGITSPILLRITDFLRYRIEQINVAFNDAISENNYKGRYQGVFPIKVNQQAQVIDRIVDYGRGFDFGLEVGSKAELLIALSHELTGQAAVICNGVKDEEFIQLALMSQRLGFNTFLVLESPREIDLVLSVAKDLGIRPQLGVRIKLTNQVSGNWAASSGDRSSFGMTIAQVMDLIEQLRREEYLDCLILQHSHLGSQVPNILEIRMAAQEACRFFSEIKCEGAPLTYLDLGGGLGIDYTGEHTATENSTNYTLEEYCANIVETVKFAMDESGVDHPTIITESGRASVAQSSLLIFNVLEATQFDSDIRIDAEEGDHHLIESMLGIPSYLDAKRVQECWNDLVYYRNEVRALFRRGQIGLRETAKAERIYLYVMKIIKSLVISEDLLNDEWRDALDQVADIYHCNFSLFQSLPDVWAINQLHPIAPIHRHNEEPSRRAILSDITCDSDGRIDRFVLEDGVSATLPVHELDHSNEYYLGVFFVGAYQETLGDLHNLFGDTHIATIELCDNGDFNLLHEQEGDTVSEVLTYVEYEPRRMLDTFKGIVDRAAAAGQIDRADRREMIATFKESINGYTYFEN